MPFVKIDTRLLDSTLWADIPAERIFMAALCMATPYELTDPTPQLAVRTLDETEWIVPAGWYGFVRAAGAGIVRRAIMNEEDGFAALERLGAPEAGSGRAAFDGRRLVRVDGGYLVLNFMVYRERDYGSAERSARYRESLKKKRRGTAKATTPTRVLADRVRQKRADQQAADSGRSVTVRDDTA